MRTYIVEVEDSDGIDSTQEVMASTEREARRKAIGFHFEQSGYPDWRDDECPCPAIVNVTVD